MSEVAMLFDALKPDADVGEHTLSVLRSVSEGQGKRYAPLSLEFHPK